MFAMGYFKQFKFVVVGGAALLLAVGCAQQTVKSDEAVASASPAMKKAGAAASPRAMSEGSMTEDMHAFLHGELTGVPGSFM